MPGSSPFPPLSGYDKEETPAVSSCKSACRLAQSPGWVAGAGGPSRRKYHLRMMATWVRMVHTRLMNGTIRIHLLDESGELGEQVGHGTAIDPTLVLVHPPLSHELANGDRDHSGLAVATASAGTAPVHGVSVADGDGEPLVALDLGTAVPADLIHDLPGPADTLRRYLTEAAPLTRISDGPPPDHRALWCAIWPTSRVCDGH